MKDAADFRARQVEQGELWEELNVEGTWFHVVRGMIYRGAIREMGTTTWAVYCALKSHIGLGDGVAWPGVERIAELVGVSHDTVNRSLKRLVEMGLVDVEKNGRQNRYMMKEKVPMTTQSGELFGVAERHYIPREFLTFVEVLKEFAKSGNLPPSGHGITINVTLNVQNIQQGDGGSVTMNVQQVTTSPAAEPATRQAIADVKRRLKRLT